MELTGEDQNDDDFRHQGYELPAADSSGETLEVLSTDPGSVKDFEAFCRSTGNELLESNEEGGVYTYMIKKSS